MSGGSMQYLYFNIESSIPSEDSILNVEALKEAKELALKARKKLEEAAIIAKRLEWRLSGDDGDKSFIRRIQEDLGYDLLKF